MSLLHRTRDAAVPPFEPSGRGESGDRRISARVHTIGCSGLRTSMVRGFRMSSGDGADVAGFDLGPSPEEHFLAALGASISQTISHLACVRGLSIDRVDVDLTGELAPDRDPSHVAGHLERITVAAEIASEDEPNLLQQLDDVVLTSTPLMRGISFPVAFSLSVIELAPKSGSNGDDWEI